MGDEEAVGGRLCTWAATGDSPTFQPIFVCRTCRVRAPDGGERPERQQHAADESAAAEAAPLCICQACSESCHPPDLPGLNLPDVTSPSPSDNRTHEQRPHEVEYIGLGPCYCDCRTLGRCLLAGRSDAEAERLFGGATGRSAGGGGGPFLRPKTEQHDGISGERGVDFPFVHGAFSLPQLRNSGDTCDRLVRQAKEMVRHTSDTFWVTPAMDTVNSAEEGKGGGGGLCELEMLALAIYRRHLEAYGLQDCTEFSGAEWWVQVKNVLSSARTTSAGMSNGNDEHDDNVARSNAGGDGAVDLHYDKDEELAASFGIGSFPTLSTVTYLTGGCDDDGDDCDENDVRPGELRRVAAAQPPHPPPPPPPPPTIVFPHTYDSTASEIEGGVLISHPRRGKHLVFDGRLLHGAPAHPALREGWRGELGGGGGNGGGGDGSAGMSDGSIFCGSVGNTVRVTFLVNIWPKCRPAGVGPLPADVRRCIVRSVADSSSESNSNDNSNVDVAAFEDLAFEELPIGTASVGNQADDNDDGDGDEEVCEGMEMEHRRIQLPFVSKGATWIEDNDDDDDGGLVLSMVPLPPSLQCDSDTVMVRYADGMEPYLENVPVDDSSDEGGQDDDNDADEGSADG